MHPSCPWNGNNRVVIGWLLDLIPLRNCVFKINGLLSAKVIPRAHDVGAVGVDGKVKSILENGEHFGSVTTTA
jgi:hypothetical protein